MFGRLYEEKAKILLVGVGQSEIHFFMLVRRS